jgi:hypothetical protein
MSVNKPAPLYFRRRPPLCPVCGMSSYSAAGVHPQCSARRMDAERMRLRRKLDDEAAASAQFNAAVNPGEKTR